VKHAALFSIPLPNNDRRPATVPPPSGPRPIAIAPAPADPPDQEAYSTIDLPAEQGIHCGVRVIVESGQSTAVVTLLPGGELVLGASAEADLAIADATVSARHCALLHHGTALEVIDLASRNGVRVAGVRVARALCSVGSSFEIGRSVVHIERATDARRGDEASEREPMLRGAVGGSPVMRQLAAAVRSVAPLRLPVLLRGESGAGKDLVARALHAESGRLPRPLVVLNAATIRAELAESELFGHERGAFTGAVRDRRGAFREAHGGTLFLDEIAALSLDVQAKLLRAVEEGAVRPLGGETHHAVDVRLVAATCEPLESMVRERRFRADLYERLAVCVLRVPALRDRAEDIPDLARHMLASSEVGVREIAPCALAVLRHQRWPGNVRELRNVLVQAAIATRGPGPIRAEHVNAVLSARADASRCKLEPGDALHIFEECGYNVSAAARRARLPRTTMRDLLCAAGAPLGVRKVEASE
jgi:DNA-binding NtrC family response regulator